MSNVVECEECGRMYDTYVNNHCPSCGAEDQEVLCS